jgi:hypothetical protein
MKAGSMPAAKKWTVRAVTTRTAFSERIAKRSFFRAWLTSEKAKSMPITSVHDQLPIARGLCRLWALRLRYGLLPKHPLGR